MARGRGGVLGGQEGHMEAIERNFDAPKDEEEVARSPFGSLTLKSEQ